ncbi:MAG: FecR domain-containing protein [Spirochaetes bacterium]|nr:FecR domain-containing protein [Spirochaetota bacterium]
MCNIHNRALSIIALSFLLFPGGCARKAGMDHGVITFKVGQASVQRAGSGPAELAPGDRVAAGDILTTGARSAVAIQFSERCVIRVDENTTFRVVKIEDKELKMFIPDGSVMGKLIRREKAGLEITTPTSLAAVRGTEFSVTYKDGRSKVAVSEGNVRAAAARHDDAGNMLAAAEKEVSVGAGKAAEVTEQPKKGEAQGSLDVELREMTAQERNDLRKINAMPIIEEPEKKSREELEQIRKSVLEIENEIDGSLNREMRAEMGRDQVQALLMKKDRTMDDIRKTFNRIDEISLYSGKVIRGAIMSRGDNFKVITPERVITVPKKDIMNMQVIK